MRSIGESSSLTKTKKYCSKCQSKNTLVYNDEETDLDPLSCPFCGYEIDNEAEEPDNEETEDNWD